MFKNGVYELNLSQLRNKTTSDEFNKLSIRESKEILLLANKLIIESSNPPDRPIFQEIELRVNSHIQAKVNKRRFVVQVFLSVLILVVATSSLINNLFPELLNTFNVNSSN